MRIGGSRRRATIVVMPAPLAAPEAMLGALPAEPGVLWAPPGGPTFSGAGVAARLDVGESGVPALRDRGRSLLAGAMVFGSPVESLAVPRLIGGLAFDPRRRGDARWRGFGAGTFILPRWTYVSDGRSAWLLLAVADPAQLRSARVLGQCRLIERALAGGGALERARRAGRVRLESRGVEPFERAVAGVLDGIRRGRHEKIVLARRVGLRSFAPFDPIAALARLSFAQPRSFRFALRLGGATFLGASPERLVRKAGALAETEALAGSSPPTPAGERALRSSKKDADEHALVVRAVRMALAPHCRAIRAPARPAIRSLPGIRHLWTPVRGALRDTAHVLDLVAALHPTPAVGGFPRGPALRFLARHEEPRGWYAGAFGWFDASGDGEFAVAIRSGLVRGRRADLWAGAGVVAGSMASAEIDEIDRKLGTMLDALGVERS